MLLAGNAVNNFRRRILIVFATGFSRWCLSNGKSGEPASAGLSVTEFGQLAEATSEVRLNPAV
jgi:hypothetical protein